MINYFLKQIKINNIPSINELQNVNIGILGTGLDGELAFNYLKSLGLNPLYYFDNDVNKHGKMLNGLEILSLSNIKNIDNLFIFVAVKSSMKAVKAQMKELNVKFIMFSEFITKYTLKNRYNDYVEVYKLLNDWDSKYLYQAMITARIEGDDSKLATYMQDNAFYNISQFKFLSNDVLVDVGAQTGDTLERFIWNSSGRFNSIYAFEPSKKQFDAMLFRKERLLKEWALDESQIKCINAGLGIKNAEQNLSLSNNPVSVYSLDSYLDGKKITLLKSDAEGFDMDLLTGASNTIKAYKPKLAINISNKYTDLLDVILYIKSLVPDYNMSIRHHSTNMNKTVLYCWI